jgi:hypothetical protein
MTTPNLPIDNLDFDTIKANLKTFLKSQDKFKDYDFEGSGMNILLDLLAYNTHYQAFYANMVANEAFIDSAVKRDSVVSLAKSLGYTPRSYRASSATVDVVWAAPTTTSTAFETFKTGVARGEVFINRGDVFVATGSGSVFTFLPMQNYKVTLEGNNCVCRGVEIKEGRFQTFTYIVNSADTAQRFIIPETQIDTSTLRVRVTKSAKDTTGIVDVWALATDINSIDGSTNAYFLQQGEDQKYEILFGDGIVGRKPSDGNAILIEYLMTRADDANGVQAFKYSGNNTTTGSGVSPKITIPVNENGTPQASYGGGQPEDIESIRYYAPRNYQSQERTVTAEDYKTILTRDYTTADSILVWGGEESDPPQYGKVFVSIKPQNATKLSTLEKLSIQNTILQRKNILGITPEVVDPDYTYLVIDMTVRYDPTLTGMGASDLEKLLSTTVDAYMTERLGKFGLNFRFSKFVTFMDGINQSITSTDANIKLQKRFEPVVGKSGVYTIKFNFDNEVYHPVDGYPAVLSSSAFGHLDTDGVTEVDAYMEDDGYGNIRIYKLVGSEKITLVERAGTLNYSNGVISLTDFNPTYILPADSTEIALTIIPLNKDIFTRRNQILVVDKENSNITVVPDSFRTERRQTSSAFPSNR